LHPLNRSAGFCHQITPVPPQRARDPDLITWLVAVVGSYPKSAIEAERLSMQQVAD
jgi:hypothetical protein